MKQLTCEMCGGTDLVKQDDLFVCQTCGTKYSVEEAKKLVVEVDNSKKMANLYERARQSLAVDDLEHAAEYYKQILDEDPNDWEAYFYSYLGETTSFTNGQAGSVATKLGNTIPAAYDMAIKTDKVEEISERLKTITTQTTSRIKGIASSGASLLRQYEGGIILSPAGKVKVDMYKRMRDIVVNTIVSCVLALASIEIKIEEIAKSDIKINEKDIKECLLTIKRARFDIANWDFSPSAGIKEKLIKNEVIQKCAQEIKELDPSFTIPESSASGGCYVATCVYGSYDCPQVWTLRRYRDNTLASTWYGRAFIRTYYSISPTLVKWFSKTKWFKKMWKWKLDRMVKKLQDNGEESTPYEDKEW